MAKEMRITALILILLMFFTGLDVLGSKSTKNHSNESVKNELERHIPVWLERYDVPGLAMVLLESGEITWTSAWGVTSLKTLNPMTTKTVCRVESISKSVTARGIMKLSVTGKIDLDDPVTEHLHTWQFPETDFEPQQITIRQLLSHSSGLALGTLGLEYPPGADKPSLTESLLKEVMMIQEPGKGFHYSNVGYHLLELLIEEVTGQPFSEYMRDEVLLPLGMTNSEFTWRDDFITPVPDGHELGGEPVSVYVYAEKGAGGLFSTAEDIAAFIQAGMLGDFYSSNSTLSEDAISDLYSPATETSGVYSLVSENYGLGHFIETLPTGEKAVFGGGQGHGWMTHFHLIPEHGDGIVILTNSSRSWPLISQILSVWTSRSGFGAVGMEKILTASTFIWGLITLIFIGCLWVMERTLVEIRSRAKKLSLPFSNTGWSTYGNLTMLLLLLSLLIWIHTREYIFLTSVFPQAGSWFILSLWIVVMTIIIHILFQKPENIDSDGSVSHTNSEAI
jgi:CubicO group peptidase (beta-lactamase class C family)